MNPLFRYARVCVGFLSLLGGLSSVRGQENPTLGYVYPAGAQMGTSVELTIGGRGLGGTESVLFNRKGVRAEVVEHVANSKKKYAAYLRQIAAIYKKAPVDMASEEFAALQEQARRIEEIKVGNNVSKVPMDASFRRLPDLSLAAFREVAEKFRMMENVQTNAEISELLRVRVTVAADAVAGACELRLSGRRGLSNPIQFQLGGFPEFLESEPNDRGQGAAFDASRPFLVNGQVMPGDVDRFRFRATAGQGLVLQLKARELIPFLADAVPGWFQATMRVLDSSGREVAYVDDFEFRPDPVFYFEVPADGEYTVEIRDSIYRGREDFVYRLEVGETPFVTSIFPLGAQLGEERLARAEGWNLGKRKVKLNTNGKWPRLVAGRVKSDVGVSNSFYYALGTGPLRVEGESLESGDSVELGETLAGLVSKKGERDVFFFSGYAGQKVKLEVRARRLGSPLDSRLSLFDWSGRLLAEADNLSAENHGLHTDHADSLLEVELPEDGDYSVRIDDVQGRGGVGFGYLLETGDAEPDFDLVLYPSGFRMEPGGSRAVSVKAFRRSGFEGPIKLSLGKENQGFRLSGAVIPAGKDSVEMVISAGKEQGLYDLSVFGAAEIGEARVRRRARPCEPEVQAFITHHFVDTSSFVVEVSGRQMGLPVSELKGEVLALGSGAKTELRLRKRNGKTGNRGSAQFEFEVSKGCEGVSIDEVREESNAYVLSLSRDPGLASEDGWLVLQCYARWQKAAKSEKVRKPKRIYVGALPAIPYRSGEPNDV